MTDTVTVTIPADVKDNSETTTDYAFMRDRALSDYPYHTIETRDREIERVTLFPHLGMAHYRWDDVTPEGQRCRFDMVTNADGAVMNLFHTLYWTRAACYQGDWCGSYAAHYVTTSGGTFPTTDPVPVCERHIDDLRRSFEGSPVTLHESERLRIGQHD